jgi:hypothetical protein
VLRACRRILRPFGRIAFFTIHPATGLTSAQRRRASRDGPIAVATARTHRQLLEAAGFTQVTETDCTAEFAATTRGWLNHWEANRDDLNALLGDHVVAERQAERRAQLRAIEDGILARSLFSACRPEEHYQGGSHSARTPAARSAAVRYSGWLLLARLPVKVQIGGLLSYSAAPYSLSTGSAESAGREPRLAPGQVLPGTGAVLG